MTLIDLLTGPWAIAPDKLLELQAIYATHFRGDKIDLPALEARLGRPLAHEQQDYRIEPGGVAVLSLSGVMAPKANLFVYLHRPTDVLLQAIKKRGRDFEANIDSQYLELIQDSYFNFFREHPEYPILIIDVDNLDFENNQHIFLKINNLIEKEYQPGITRIKLKEIMND